MLYDFCHHLYIMKVNLSGSMLLHAMDQKNILFFNSMCSLHSFIDDWLMKSDHNWFMTKHFIGSWLGLFFNLCLALHYNSTNCYCEVQFIPHILERLLFWQFGIALIDYNSTDMLENSSYKIKAVLLQLRNARLHLRKYHCIDWLKQNIVIPIACNFETQPHLCKPLHTTYITIWILIEPI